MAALASASRVQAANAEAPGATPRLLGSCGRRGEGGTAGSHRPALGVVMGSVYLSINLSICLMVYVCSYVYTYMYVYIYIHICTEIVSDFCR